MVRSWWFVFTPVLALALTLPATAADSAVKYPTPGPNSADEAKAKNVSLPKAAEFLDSVAVNWTRVRKCGTCHTNYAYMLARPTLKDCDAPALKEVRHFFEDRAAHWETAKPRWDTEVVATAVTLAFQDAQTTGKLHPVTRKALDKMWTLQQANGAWNWLKCNWPPMEHDDYYGATFAALGAGFAPDSYAETPAAKKGLARLREQFKKTRPPDLHHKAMLLWASLKVDGLMTAEDCCHRQGTQGPQRGDGGWSLPSLGNWKRKNNTANDPKAPSDGYGTGFVVYILRQTGISAGDTSIAKGIAWLKTNQRVSGRWFTRSLNTDNYHFITNAGTAFAVMALQACEEKQVKR